MEPDLNPCNEPGYIKDVNDDPIPPFCGEKQTDEFGNPIQESLGTPFGDVLSWLDEPTLSKKGIGQSALCDPMQKGHIINAQGDGKTDPNVIYRYGKSIRGTDEAMRDMFRDVVVLDENGKAHNVPCFWGTQEQAVAVILQENVRQDNSTVVDRIRLPMLAIHQQSCDFNQQRYTYHKAVDYLRDYKNNWRPGFAIREGRHERDTVFGVTRGIPVDIGYTLYAWTMYEEDMDQILTQVITKFSPMAYIRVRGISWEIGVKLNSIANNINYEPGEKTQRVIKYQFEFTAESFVTQPIVRKKSVLKTKVEMVNSNNEDEITEVISRLEEAVKGLENV
jgi:hypothetical protein